MKVALDATALGMSSGGLARYTSELAFALAGQFPEDEYYLISDQPFQHLTNSFANLRWGSGPASVLERRWWLWGIQRELGRIGADVFHGTNFAVPFIPLRPAVMSLHDLSPWMERSWHHGAGSVRRRAPLA